MICLEQVANKFSQESAKIDDKLLTIRGATDMFGVNRKTVEQWLLDPGCPRLYVGGSKQVRFIKVQLMKYLEERSQDWMQYL